MTNKMLMSVGAGILALVAGTTPSYAQSALSAWQQAEYNAIRGAGATAPIMIEPGGSRPNNLLNPLDLSVYTSMTNIIVDPHVYAYQDNYSTDAGTNAANVAGMISAGQQVISADGPAPVIIGEYGDSVNDTSAGGTQNVQAVLASGVGSAAWSWVSGDGEDALQENNQLTGYGQLVAGFIKSGGSAPVCAVSAVPPTAVTAPDLAQGSTAVTAPAMAPAATAVTAPTLAPAPMTVEQVAALAAGN